MWWRWLLLLTLVGVAVGQDEEEKPEIEPEVCLEAPETGVCRAAIPQWFYNVTSGFCDEFIWGGCPGSRNRFSTRAACIRGCSQDVCSLPPDVGPCRGMIRMWFYDAGGRQCKEFSYGGCEGNENLFPSQAHCETACAASNLPCEIGDTFRTIGGRAVHQQYRDRDWFVTGCNRKCQALCLEDHPWGTCLAFSVRKRWWGGCNCYLYDRFLSTHEFDPDTKGTTRNRVCVQPAANASNGRGIGSGGGRGGGRLGGPGRGSRYNRMEP